MKKFYIILMFVALDVFAGEAEPDIVVKKANNKRALITELRGGDYAHAGDKEAINYVLTKLENYVDTKQGNVLDIGSGYGGTANYLYRKGFKKIWGVDKDANAVAYASQKYQSVKFFKNDVAELNKRFRKDFFSFTYMFNVIYAIPNKQTLLRNIAKISKPGALLVIFDYTKLQGKEEPNYKGLPPKPTIFKDFAGDVMYPIELENFKLQLAKTGWNLIELIDLNKEYIGWYEKIMNKISIKRDELLKTYSSSDIEEVENLFGKLLFNLRNEKLGGCLIIAEKI